MAIRITQATTERWELGRAVPVKLTIGHELTCLCVPTQVEGAVTVDTFGVVTSYYFRYRHGRWSLSVGMAPELDEDYVEIAAGLIGGRLDGGLDFAIAVQLIDAVLVAWATEGYPGGVGQLGIHPGVSGERARGGLTD